MSSSDYRKRTQRKGIITTVIAGVVIIAAVVAIVIAIIALTNNSDDKTAPADATSAATEAGSAQPTMYRGDAVTPTQPLPTTVPSGTTPTNPSGQTATETPAVTPTEAPAVTPTESGNTGSTPIDPGAAETPADNVDNSGTGAIRSEAPVDSYTDDSGVLHIITPAGYNWTYQCDGSHVSITCDPQGDRYEFLVTGIAPGSEDIIPQYFVSEDKSAWVRVPVTVYVDENLRVTVAG